MKPILKIIPLILLTLIVVFLSCKKEHSCQGSSEKNKSPVAIAGPDQLITLPTDSISLDGSASNDPDGMISEWLWTKISGPASFNITKASDSVTKVRALTVGIYLFELKVTDNGGFSARDTMKVIVDYVETTNHPPVAIAGPDQTITLPTTTVNLDGSASNDSDNNITGYSWIKISGPLSLNIINAGSVQTQVANLVQGIYQFELKVTDAGGLSSRDTTKVTVLDQSPPPQLCDNSNRPQINAQLIPFGTLSQAREGLAVASAGNKIFFAGGSTPYTGHSSRVDIYDIATRTWSTAELCEARSEIGAIAVGNKVFFGGGEIGDGTVGVDDVDIYDVSTNTWKVDHLSVPGASIAAATVGDKVFFAGGDEGVNGVDGRIRANTVDIYNLTTHTWSTTLLSEQKLYLSAVSANNKIYFAGGLTPVDPNGCCNFRASNRIDIYDDATNSWATSSMQEGKSWLAGIAIKDKIYWAGGFTGGGGTSTYTSCSIEIKNLITGNSSIEQLFKPAFWPNCRNAVVNDNKIIFYGAVVNEDNKFDVYDILNDTWSIGVLPQGIQGFSIISVNNTIYVAGGFIDGTLSNQVWKLEF